MTDSIDVLYILAHPDDESFGQAGSMLLAHEMGITTGYICATLGEAGEIRDDSLATKATLGARRELELRNAMKLANLTELRLLGYRDSGMIGTPENDDPRSLFQANEDEVAARLVATIRRLRPKSVVSFGPDGGYGHPDHIRIGKLTDRAVLDAADDGDTGLGDPWKIEAYYHVAIPRERILESKDNPDSPYFDAPADFLATLGNPSEDITHWIDTTSVFEKKFEILMQHATQIARTNPMANLDNEITKQLLGTETLIQQDLPWDQSEPDPISVIRDKFPAK